MNQLFTAYHELQPYGSSRSSDYESAVYRLSNRLLSTIRRSDLIVVLGLCAIGLVLTVAAMAWLPDFAAVIAQIGALS